MEFRSYFNPMTKERLKTWLKRIIQTKTFKVLKVVFWVVYFGAVFHLLDFIIVNNILHIPLPPYHSGGYGNTISYKIIKLFSDYNPNVIMYMTLPISFWLLLGVGISFLIIAIFKKKLTVKYLLPIIVGVIVAIYFRETLLSYF